MNNSAKKDRLDSDSLHRLDQGSEALYDLVMSGNDQDELPSDVLEIMDDEPRYEQEDDIASGGMKKISSAYDKLFRRPVAKAELKKKSRHEVITNFINEARIMARLEHPNIVPVYDLDANEEYTADESCSRDSLIGVTDLARLFFSPMLNKETQEPISLYGVI